MNRNLREKIEELLAKKMITPNLGFLCLASLNELIEYSNRDYGVLVLYRETIAKVLIANNVDKKLIIEKINTIHKECYLTLDGVKHAGHIRSVYEMIVNEEYTFVEETIPEHFIKYKSEEDIKNDMARIPRKVNLDAEERVLFEIVSYIEVNFKEIPRKRINQEKIKELQTEEYTLELIRDTFRICKNDINRALWDKRGQDVGLFEYVLKIVQNHLPERYKQYKVIEEQERTIWRSNAYSVYLGDDSIDEKVKFFCEYEQYKGKEKEVKAKLERGLEELKEIENYRAICKREREESKIQSRQKAEFKPRTKKKLSSKFEELW